MINKILIIILMILTKESKKLLNLSKRINISKLPINELKLLKNSSIPIISELIKNIKIEFIKNIKIKHNFKGSLISKLLKKTKSNKFPDFLEAVKNNRLSQKEIYDFINFNNDEIHNILASTNYPEDINRVLKYYPNDLLSKFVPPSIQDDIINNLHLLNIYQVNYNTNLIKFYMYTDSEPDYNRIIVLFLKTFYLLETFKVKNQNIPIYLLFSNKKKTITKNQSYLGPREINSGVSSIPYFDNISPKICIFREEEIEKLILHELVHATKIDKNINLDSDQDKLLKCSFNISKNLSVNFREAFTESIAFILNIVFNSILSLRSLEEIYINELKFSIYQCSNIIKFYGYKSVDEFFCERCCMPGSSQWNEKTSVFSYFILKTCIVYGTNRFIKNILKQNNTNIDGLIKEIKSNFKNIKHNIQQQITKKTSLKKSISLRMTAYDFNWMF